MTSSVKIKLQLTTNEITSNYVFDTIFKISQKSLLLKHAEIAKEIVTLAAKKGEEGLHDDDWKEFIQKYAIKQHTYFYILKRLKDAGILRKSKGKYYVIWDFIDHLGNMSTVMNNFYRDIGAIRQKQEGQP